MHKVSALEYKNTSDRLLGAIDFWISLEEKPYGNHLEKWLFLCDKYGYKYVYSMCLSSTSYGDGYLDSVKKIGWHDWVACCGSEVYNKIVIKADDLKEILSEYL